MPPIKSPESSGSTPAPPALGKSKEGGTINGEMYVVDGDYIKDIEVNDLHNRYLLTNSSNQHRVSSAQLHSFYRLFFYTDILS